VWTLLHLILSPLGAVADDYWGPALLVLFAVALLLAFIRYAGDRPSLRSQGSKEDLPEPVISRFFLASRGASAVWFVVRMNVGSLWLLAGWEKVSSPSLWGTSGKALSGFVAGALAKSSGRNPDVQGWYAWFLQHIVAHTTPLFSFLVTFGEFAVGAAVLLGVLTGIAAGFGVLLNLDYLLAGAVSINPVLGMFGLLLVLSWRVCGWIGGDRWLLPALGLPWKPGTLFRPPARVVT
jgi:thiosulfate dehydrogenase [quinone] large subunit